MKEMFFIGWFKFFPDPVVIEIDGHVTTQRGGDTIIYFTSNHDQLTYQCILMPDGIESPVINTCEFILISIWSDV